MEGGACLTQSPPRSGLQYLQKADNLEVPYDKIKRLLAAHGATMNDVVKSSPTSQMLEISGGGKVPH